MELCSGPGEVWDVKKFGFCELVNLLILKGCKILISLNSGIVNCE